MINYVIMEQISSCSREGRTQQGYMLHRCCYLECAQGCPLYLLHVKAGYNESQ